MNERKTTKRNPNRRMGRFKVALLLAAASALAACSGKSVSEVLEGGKSDASKSGIVTAERRPQGTVFMSFKGLPGAESYVIYESERPAQAAARKRGVAQREAENHDQRSTRAVDRPRLVVRYADRYNERSRRHAAGTGRKGLARCRAHLE